MKFRTYDRVVFEDDQTKLYGTVVGLGSPRFKQVDIRIEVIFDIYSPVINEPLVKMLRKLTKLELALK